MANLRWRGEAVVAETARRVVVAMSAAGSFLEGRVKRKINRGNRTGRFPSRPGEPPKKVTGNLQKSITHEVENRGRVVVTRVGTNIKYGRYLEFGTDGSAGRARMAARPFLRPTLFENFRTAARLVIGRLG